MRLVAETNKANSAPWTRSCLERGSRWQFQRRRPPSVNYLTMPHLTEGYTPIEPGHWVTSPPVWLCAVTSATPSPRDAWFMVDQQRPPKPVGISPVLDLDGTRPLPNVGNAANLAAIKSALMTLAQPWRNLGPAF